jgi:hypothetical protein
MHFCSGENPTRPIASTAAQSTNQIPLPHPLHAKITLFASQTSSEKIQNYRQGLQQSNLQPASHEQPLCFCTQTSALECSLPSSSIAQFLGRLQAP